MTTKSDNEDEGPLGSQILTIEWLEGILRSLKQTLVSLNIASSLPIDVALESIIECFSFISVLMNPVNIPGQLEPKKNSQIKFLDLAPYQDELGNSPQVRITFSRLEYVDAEAAQLFRLLAEAVQQYKTTRSTTASFREVAKYLLFKLYPRYYFKGIEQTKPKKRQSTNSFNSSYHRRLRKKSKQILTKTYKG
jgi:hypothetical protein